ncbi:sentrin-specific protease-like isoform X1 [Babylonia areolata]|uniref:sentrin-specific protease-like isoform X1 n=1 Tax=Babylonia areolata TaxID=304850 RepID=UPI003FD5B911
MFKSFSDSIRSLWQSKTPDKTSARKRKRTLDDADLDDSDVEILSVKKPRRENSSSSGLLSFLTIPVSKMSDWVRKKTVRQDHVFVQPIPKRNTHNRGRGEPQELLHTRSSSSSLTTNGSFSHLQNTSRLSRLPLHSQNGAHENGVNGDVQIVDFQPGFCSRSSSSSRRSSCSSVRPGRGRRSTVDQCFQLKEKEDYRKLLQQYTSIDLGYNVDKQKTTTAQGSSARNFHTRGTPRLSVLSSSSSSVLSSSLPSSDSVSSRPKGIPPSTRFRVHPNHFTESPLLPCDRVSEHSTVAAFSGRERGGTQGRCGWGQQVCSPTSATCVRHRSQRENAHQDEGLLVDTPPLLTDSDPEVIIVEDTHGSSSRQSPPLNFKFSQYLDDDWINRLNSKYASAERERQRLIEEAEMKKKLLEERREGRLGNLDKRLRLQMKLFDDEVEVIEDLPEVEEETPLPELTDQMQREIAAALGGGPQTQVLSEGFRLQLTRADFATLQGLNWLNDEVINFYMNMLMERGERDASCKTYAFNTFFYPKLLAGGHAAVKRWTRRVDLFSHTYLVIPVHLGVHWCLCMVFVKEKCIRYYDSMGGNNNQCLNAIRQYLHDESLQKRNVELDLSEWSTETVKDIPQQMNGSDCGMFSCMYAESLTRGAKITFTQKDMPYFRRRMVYELLKKQLL